MTNAAVMPSAVSNAPALDGSLRDYLETNADIVTHINKPVSIDDIGALSAQSDLPIVFETIIEKPGFRLCDILVKNRKTQARALGAAPADYLKTLAFRLRQPPRGFRLVKSAPVKEIIKTGAQVDWTTLPIPKHKDADAKANGLFVHGCILGLPLAALALARLLLNRKRLKRRPPFPEVGCRPHPE